MKLTPIRQKSSHLSAIGYAGGELTVRFDGGAVYKYEGVSAKEAAAIRRAKHPGSRLAEVVAGKEYERAK